MYVLYLIAVVESLGGKMTNEELDAMLLEVDDNNDGYLDYDGDFKIQNLQLYNKI